MGDQNGENLKVFPTNFVNKPLKKGDRDAFHMQVQVKELEKAIQEGANLIGIVSEHGGGKSSIVRSLCDSKSGPHSTRKYKLCNICLWTFEGWEKDSKEGKMNAFTHSFLYQLSKMVKKDGFTRHINRIMSLNYRTISFSTDIGKRFWVLLIVALTVGVLLMPFENVLLWERENINRSSASASLEEDADTADFRIGWKDCVIAVLEEKTIVRLLAVGLLLYGFGSKSIAFSWKDSEQKSEMSVADTYEVFEKIIARAKEGEKQEKRYIINMEDLDRISDNREAMEFLKVLYKYNSLLDENDRKKFVFVVSLSTAAYLNAEDEKLYNKIFDYILMLKPVNREKKEDLLMHILENKKTDLHGVLNRWYLEAGEREWILRGSDWGIRELKFRLNKALAIYEELDVQEGEGAENIKPDFEKCAVSAYLESVYPADMYRFTCCPYPWHQVMRQLPSDERFLVRLKKELAQNTDMSQEFKQELENLFSQEQWSPDDYWTYFYRNPGKCKPEQRKKPEEAEA